MKINRGKEMPLPTKLTFNEHGCMIFAETDHPNMLVADLPYDGRSDKGETARVRGWGYLTGRGGLNLTDEEAIAYQDRIGQRLVNCWNACAAAGLTDEELEVLMKMPPQVVARMLNLKR